MTYFTMSYGNIGTVSSEDIKKAVEEVAPSLIEEAVGTVVDNKIDDKISTVTEQGNADDVRAFDTFSSFPASGVEDVEYIALDTGYEYAWDGTSYVLLNEHERLNDEDINGLGNWN